MTDNAPELSGQRENLPTITGREPVLTGHNARVLADRRGAYLAGNWQYMYIQMTEPQRRQFLGFYHRTARSLERHGAAVFSPIAMYEHTKVQAWDFPFVRPVNRLQYLSMKRCVCRAAYIILQRG